MIVFEITLPLRKASRRATAMLSSSHFHPGGDVTEINAKAQAFAKEVLTRYSEAHVTEARRAAEAAVADVRVRRRRREEFDGKKILRAFFQEHLGNSTLSRQVFAFYAARRARRRRSVIDFFDQFFENQRIIARRG